MKSTFFKNGFFVLCLALCFFIFTPAYAEAATLYWFKSGADANWTTRIGNWWTDINHTAQAGALPTDTDATILLGSTAPSINFDTWVNPASIDATATGLTLDSESQISGTISGDIIFNQGTINMASITGTVIFNDHSSNSEGSVTGTTTFNGTATTLGLITGTTTFNGASVNAYSNIVGPATFNDTSRNTGGVIGATTFNASSTNSSSGTVTGTTTFNATSTNQGSIIGATTFNASSTNSSSGTVTGSTTFNASSTNQGSISGATTFNASSTNSSSGTVTGSTTFNTYSHNEGTINGIVTLNTTYYASTTPTGGILSLENSAIWKGTYGATIRGSDSTMISTFIFYGSSSNATTIASTTIFYGDLSENNGTISGTKTRLYASNATTTRNFTTGGIWTVKADGAVVNVSGATFTASTTFTTLNGGSFPTISTNCSSSLLGGGLSYVLSGNVTATCTIGVNNVTLGGGGYTLTGNIVATGILAGANGFTITISNITVTGSITANGNSNTSPGTGGNITISTSTTGAIIANGGNNSNANGGTGGTITLSYSTSTTLTANGGNSTGCGYGGSGGTIVITDSTYTSATTDVGSNGTTSCGSAGSGGSTTYNDNIPPVITITGANPLTIAHNSTYTELGATAVDAVSGSRTVVITGSVNTAVAGTYTKTYTATDAAGNSASATRSVIVSAAVNGCTDSTAENYSASATADDGSCTYAAATPAVTTYGGGFRLSVAQLQKLGFTPLPSFTTDVASNLGSSDFGNVLDGLNSPGSLKLSKISFTFVPRVSSFLFAPLPDSITSALRQYSALSGVIASVGISYEQDLVTLPKYPIELVVSEKGKVPPGLFVVSASSTPLRLFVTGDEKYRLAELVRVEAGAILTIKLEPLSREKVTAQFNDTTVTFFSSPKGGVYVITTAPTIPGRYYFITRAAPLPLIIEVVEPPKPPPPKKQSFLTKILGWFK